MRGVLRADTDVFDLAGEDRLPSNPPTDSRSQGTSAPAFFVFLRADLAHGGAGSAVLDNHLGNARRRSRELHGRYHLSRPRIHSVSLSKPGPAGLSRFSSPSAPRRADALELTIDG